MNSVQLKSVAVAGLVVLAASVSGGAAQAAATSKPVSTTTCSAWQNVGDSTVSARTCLTVKDLRKKALVRGAVQLMNTGTETANVKATWTVTVDRGKSGKAVKVRTVTVKREVPATGETVKLSGQANRLDAAGLAAVRASIVVVAQDSGTDIIAERISTRL